MSNELKNIAQRLFSQGIIGPSDFSNLHNVADFIEEAPAVCVCGHAEARHEMEPPYPCYECGCGRYTPAPAGEQEGEHDGN